MRIEPKVADEFVPTADEKLLLLVLNNACAAAAQSTGSSVMNALMSVMGNLSEGNLVGAENAIHRLRTRVGQ